MQGKLPLWQRIIKVVLASLLTVLLLAAFYIAVIMGNPQEEKSSAITARQDQPLLPAMASPILIHDESQLNVLLAEFPAPVMAAMHSSIMTFHQGLAEDIPFESGLSRRITLTYRTAEGTAVTVTSIYPARALSLIEKGEYTISGTSGLPLAGLRSVRMEKPGVIRMHAQGTDALYAVTLPEQSAAMLRTLTSMLQLYQGG